MSFLSLTVHFVVFCSLKILFKVRNGNSQESESWLACKSLGQGLGCPSRMVCSEFPQPLAASTLLLLCLLLCCAFLSPTYSKSTHLSKVVSNSLWYLSGMLWVYLCDVVVVVWWFLMNYISYCICHLGGHWSYTDLICRFIFACIEVLFLPNIWTGAYTSFIFPV